MYNKNIFKELMIKNVKFYSLIDGKSRTFYY